MEVDNRNCIRDVVREHYEAKLLLRLERFVSNQFILESFGVNVVLCQQNRAEPTDYTVGSV